MQRKKEGRISYKRRRKKTWENDLDSLRWRELCQNQWRCDVASRSSIQKQHVTAQSEKYWLVLTDLWATKPQKPLFWPHAHTLPPKQCLSLSSLTVVYSRQWLDGLISCCLTGPPPWIRHRSDTLNLASFSHCSALYMAIESRHASSPLREATRASPSRNLRLEPAWLLCMPGRPTNCLSRWWFAQGERKMKELHPTKGRKEKWRERLTTQKEVPWLNKCKPLNTAGRESQWHDNKHDCVYNN